VGRLKLDKSRLIAGLVTEKADDVVRVWV